MTLHRCTHRGTSCVHRTFEPHAVRVGPEGATWRDVGEIVGGTIFLLLVFAALAYGPWLLWGGR
jgi:hypothetical protein